MKHRRSLAISNNALNVNSHSQHFLLQAKSSSLLSCRVVLVTASLLSLLISYNTRLYTDEMSVKPLLVSKGVEHDYDLEVEEVDNREDFMYIPASTEEYIMNHFEELGYHSGDWKRLAKGCPIWKNPETSTQENYDNLTSFRQELNNYSNALAEFDKPVPDFVKTIRKK